MKKSILIIMVILALSFVLFAQKMDKKPMDDCQNCKQGEMMKGDGPQGMDPMDNPGEMMKGLGLTPEQQKKIDALRDEHKKFMNTKKAELQNLHIDKQNAMQAEDYTKAKQVNKSINDMQLIIENSMVDFRAAMAKELTPEQREKLRKMMPMGPQGKQMMMNHKMMKDGKGGMDKPCTGDCK
jgi:Spy/CpxP family protein refolding chaperone